MMAAREKDQADFDLERFIEMFDEALTSQDPRVMKTLRDLMMIVTLTRPESPDQLPNDRQAGPLRRLFDDMNNLNRRLHRLEDEMRQARAQVYSNDAKYPNEKYYTIQATQQIAQHVDQDVFDKLKQENVSKYTGGAIKGLYDK